MTKGTRGMEIVHVTPKGSLIRRDELEPRRRGVEGRCNCGHLYSDHGPRFCYEGDDCNCEARK